MQLSRKHREALYKYAYPVEQAKVDELINYIAPRTNRREELDYLVKRSMQSRFAEKLYWSCFEPLSPEDFNKLFRRIISDIGGISELPTTMNDYPRFVLKSLSQLAQELQQAGVLEEFRSELDRLTTEAFKHCTRRPISYPASIIHAEDLWNIECPIPASYLEVYQMTCEFLRHMAEVQMDLFGEVNHSSLIEFYQYLWAFEAEYEPLIEQILNYIHLGEVYGISEIKQYHYESTLERTTADLENIFKEFKRSDTFKLEVGQEVLNVGDYKWVILPTGCSEGEGAAMGHCGNIGGAPEARILSLRSIRTNQPHLTFIAHFIPEIFEDLHGFAMHEDEFTTEYLLQTPCWLGEMKGRANKKPAAKYHSAIVQLLEQPFVFAVIGGGYEPENNFQIGDLSPFFQERLLQTKPQFFNAEALKTALLDFTGMDCFRHFVGNKNLRAAAYRQEEEGGTALGLAVEAPEEERLFHDDHDYDWFHDDHDYD